MGTLGGLIVGILASLYLILPPDVLHLRLAAMTIGDLLHLLAAVVAILSGVRIGHWVDQIRRGTV